MFAITSSWGVGLKNSAGECATATNPSKKRVRGQTFVVDAGFESAEIETLFDDVKDDWREE